MVFTFAHNFSSVRRRALTNKAHDSAERRPNPPPHPPPPPHQGRFAHVFSASPFFYRHMHFGASPTASLFAQAEGREGQFYLSPTGCEVDSPAAAGVPAILFSSKCIASVR